MSSKLKSMPFKLSKVYCNNYTEFISLVKLFEIENSFTTYVFSQIKNRVGFRENEKIIIIFEEDKISICGDEKCSTCSYCSGYTEIIGSKFLRDKKLDRILK